MSQGEQRVQAGGAAPIAVNSVDPLFSPRQVALATVLGGPLGGGALIALNYRRLGQAGKAGIAIVGSALALGVLVALLLIRTTGAFVQLGALVVVAVPLLARASQGVAYDRHVALGGRRGSWWLVLGVGISAFAISFAVAIVADVIVIRASQPDKLMVGHNTVFYTDGVAPAEARRVGEELDALARARGDQSPDSRWGIEVTRDGGRAVVAFVVLSREGLDDVDLRTFYQGQGALLSLLVYKGAPVDVWVVDGLLKPHVKLPWESNPLAQINRGPRPNAAGPSRQEMR